MTASGPGESADAPSVAPRPIALLRSHDDLRLAVRQWCAENRVTRMELDARAGLADGHASKLLAIHPHKKFGSKSMWRVLAANGLALALINDPESQITAEHASEDASVPPRQRPRRKRGPAWGRQMAARRVLKQSKEQRREIARKAAQARWQRRHEGTLSKPD
jgi:hypothetical protein